MVAITSRQMRSVTRSGSSKTALSLLFFLNLFLSFASLGGYSTAKHASKCARIAKDFESKGASWLKPETFAKTCSGSAV